MKKVLQYKTLYISLLLVFFSFNSFSQSSFTAKMKGMFTRKAQIAVLNHQIDSLKADSKEKDNALLDEKENSRNLEVKLNESIKKTDIANQKNASLENEVLKFKNSLDSLHKLNLESHTYTKAQRTEDSVRYQNLLKKLSEQNTFLVDSLNNVANIRKPKQEPTKIENYYFKDFKSVITGIPDAKNRYTWSFELFQKINDEYIKAENSAMFNDKKQELLNTINNKIQKEFNIAYKTDPKCFTSKVAPTYDFKNLGIEFQDGKMIFYAIFNFTTDYCKYLYGYTSVEFTAEEIQPFLK